MTDKEIISEVNRCISMEADAIGKLTEVLDEKAVLETAKALQNCKGKVILSGCGTSAMAAKKIAHSLCCIEIPALFLSPADAVHGGLGVLQEDDILILISKGGNTQELVNLIPACRTKKAKLIGVSENPDSKIAQAADIYESEGRAGAVPVQYACNFKHAGGDLHLRRHMHCPYADDRLHARAVCGHTPGRGGRRAAAQPHRLTDRSVKI